MTYRHFSAYQTDVKSLVLYLLRMTCQPIPQPASVNLNKAQFTGGEVGLKWKQDDLFLSTEYAYVETENKATGLEIAYRPKQTLTLTTGLENSVYGIRCFTGRAR